MKILITCILICSIAICISAQNILVYSGDLSFLAEDITSALTLAGYSYKQIADVPLTTEDFIGIDLLFDVTMTISSNECTSNLRDSLPAIQNYLNSGGAVFWQFDNLRIDSCSQIKFENLINPYLNVPDIADSSSDISAPGYITNTLPSYKSSILATPTNIVGRRIDTLAGTSFDGVDENSCFTNYQLIYYWRCLCGQ